MREIITPRLPLEHARKCRNSAIAGQANPSGEFIATSPVVRVTARQWYLRRELILGAIQKAMKKS